MMVNLTTPTEALLSVHGYQILVIKNRGEKETSYAAMMLTSLLAFSFLN